MASPGTSAEPEGEPRRHASPGPAGAAASSAPAARAASPEYSQLQDAPLPAELPGLVLLSAVVFPYEVASVQIDRPRSVRMLEDNPGENVLVACFYPQEGDAPAGEGGGHGKVLPVGVACRVIHRMRMPNQTMQVVFQGVRRIRLVEVLQTDPYHRWRVAPVEARDEGGSVTETLIYRCMELLSELLRLDPSYPAEVVKLLGLNLGGPGRFADLLGSQLRLSLPERRRIAATPDSHDRLVALESWLREAIRRRRLEAEVTEEIDADVERVAKEDLLRAQLESIRRRLGEDEGATKAVADLRARLAAADLPPHAREAAESDVRRLEGLPPSSVEAQNAMGHLGWILDLPWNDRAPPPVDLAKAREVLDRNHFGLEDVKERLLEYLAVVGPTGAARGPVLCLVGPAGVGKTSIGRSVAEASGRGFVRLSVAGVDDEEVIKGTRRGTPGALPGRILRGLKAAGTRHPVFMVDEIDKMGREEGGNLASALLEVLDPESNAAFVDAYLDLPFDLSGAFFVATANVIFDVPRSLRDRLEVISLPGYTYDEKLQIARRHLLPVALARAGFSEGEVAFSDAALREIVSGYTREAGARSLERVLARAGRKLALLRGLGRFAPHAVDVEHVPLLLGPALYEDEVRAREPEVGVTAGLAWTADGGVVQLIEVISMAGGGHIVVTGRLGDVMRESADIAYSWARANAKELGFEDKDVRDLDLHVHAPEGGVRKDGPSAGVAIVTAIVSVFTRRPVRADVAMTGELTLRGRVLDVGGIREKVSAASRSGIRRILLPASNKKDVDALSEDLRRGMQFEFFDRITQYLDAALLPPAPD
jgi:ATP-dependent Lon protease